MRERLEVHEAIFQDGWRCRECTGRHIKQRLSADSERLCNHEACDQETDLINQVEEYIDTALDMNLLPVVIEEYGLAKDMCETIGSWINHASKAKELLIEMVAINVVEHGWYELGSSSNDKSTANK